MTKEKLEEKKKEFISKCNTPCGGEGFVVGNSDLTNYFPSARLAWQWIEELVREVEEGVIKQIADHMDSRIEKKPSLIGDTDFITIIHELKRILQDHRTENE